MNNDLRIMMQEMFTEMKEQEQESWNVVIQYNNEDENNAIEYIEKLLTIGITKIWDGQIIITSNNKEKNINLIDILTEEYEIIKSNMVTIDDNINCSLPFGITYKNELETVTLNKTVAPGFDEKEYKKLLSKLKDTEEATLKEFNRTFIEQIFIDYLNANFRITFNNDLDKEKSNFTYLVNKCLNLVEKELKINFLCPMISDYYFEFTEKNHKTIGRYNNRTTIHSVYEDIQDELEILEEKFDIIKIGLKETVQKDDFDSEDRQIVEDKIRFNDKYKMSGQASDINESFSNVVLYNSIYDIEDYSLTMKVTSIISLYYMDYLDKKQSALMDIILKREYVNPSMTMEEMIKEVISKSF